MSNSYYEIVELASGDIALQRIDGEGDGEPLVRVTFSDEVKFFLQEQYVDIAKAMINTGIRIVGQIQDENEAESEADSEAQAEFDDDEYNKQHTLH